MPERFLIIDGHNLLFRMFYGMPNNFYTSNKVKYNALYGFVSAILKVTSLINPTHMLVVFDSKECGDRRVLDSDYKANRPDYSEMTPEECPFTQLPYIYKALSEMNVPYAEIHGCEADDVISSYAIKYGKYCDVIIMSTDRDYWQLVSDKVFILNYHGMDSTLVTPQTVRSKYGVDAAQFADFKCLVGDKSDNIVGVPGIGPKTAALLLSKFGNLGEIIKRTSEIEKVSIRKALEESVERLELNNRLIKLSGEAELPFEFDKLELKLHIPRNTMLFCQKCTDQY